MRDDMKPKEWQGNGWTQYQKLVLAELERLSEETTKIKESLSNIQIEIAMLKVKSGLWGGVAGLFTVLIGVLIQYVSQKKG